jgi:hypothetical protein
MNKIILGTGICARAVMDSFHKTDIDLFQPMETQLKTELNYHGINFVLSDINTGGLSNRYHGIIPGKTINNVAYNEYLKTLKLRHLSQISDETYYVPWQVPRPNLKRAANINLANIDLSRKIYLCLSVLGNLSFLQNNGLLKNKVTMSDDLIIKFAEFKNLPIKYFPKFFYGGAVFPVIKTENGIISFRPVYGEDNSIDFTKNVYKQLFLNNPLQILSKVQQAIYLKFGLLSPLKKPLRWVATLQLNIPNFYTLLEGKVTINDGIFKIAEKNISHAYALLKQKIPETVFCDAEYFNGIHLGYDRAILANIPRNIRVYDMSLNQFKGEHPTVQVYCNIRKMLDE